MMLVCTNGEDKDMQARFTATSVGGKRAVQALAVAQKNRCSTAMDQNPTR